MYKLFVIHIMDKNVFPLAVIESSNRACRSPIVGEQLMSDLTKLFLSVPISSMAVQWSILV